MKKLLTILLCLYSLHSFAQDTTFYDGSWDKVNSRSEATYYTLIKNEQPDSFGRAVVKSYTLSGQIIEEINYSNFKKYILDGTFKEWYKDGKPRKDIDYTNGAIDGKLITYWKSGKLKRKDKYINDSFISGECFNSTGGDTQWYEYQQMPVYPGGEDAMMSFISSSVVYPKEAMDMNAQARVYVTFIVSKTGFVKSVNVKKFEEISSPPKNKKKYSEYVGAFDLLKEEAIRVIRNMPYWTPGRLDGELVSISYVVPIKFILR